MRFGWIFLLGVVLAGCGDGAQKVPVTEVAREAVAPKEVRHVKDEMALKGFEWGAPAYVRIFKKEAVLEVWLKKSSGEYARFREFPICIFSGELGPKLKTGDKQSPEGFYAVNLKALNPNSRYHLSFNLGFPNEFDRAHGYTGSYLMVHGDCVSVGCYAMGDRQIEEIYTLVAQALQHGQAEVPVHVFPFKMTRENLLAYQGSKWLGFWRQLKPAYDFFEQYHLPPIMLVRDKRYELDVLNSQRNF